VYVCGEVRTSSTYTKVKLSLQQAVETYRVVILRTNATETAKLSWSRRSPVLGDRSSVYVVP
jgi:hypothetical protein